jgi:hypothetical protein
MEVYEIKERTEHWILFKFLKLVAIYGGVYCSFMFLSVWILSGRRGRRPILAEQLLDPLSSLANFVSIAVVIWYLYTKLKRSELDKLEFDDDANILKLTFRNYLFHFKYSKNIPYASLSCKSRTSNSFLHGEYEHVEFYSGRKKMAVIGSASPDWHKLPNSIERIKSKIYLIKYDTDIGIMKNK